MARARRGCIAWRSVAAVVLALLALALPSVPATASVPGPHDGCIEQPELGDIEGAASSPEADSPTYVVGKGRSGVQRAEAAFACADVARGRRSGFARPPPAAPTGSDRRFELLRPAGANSRVLGVSAGSAVHRSAPSGLADDLLGAACSFSGETHVLMADGTTKPIEDVEVGDWVLAEDPETGERGAREVTHLWVHQDTIIDLEIGGHDVATTEDHPFWDHTDNEWQRADALDAGDLVLAADGATLTVGAVGWGSTRTTTAYNLTVNDIHTYFVGVGDDEVLVHNTNGCNLWKLTREGAESTRRHSRFGTFYETLNRYGDSMWLTTDTAQHGGSYFKMYEETSTGLRWVADLDEFGTILADKHKSDVGAFIPWKELGR